KRAYCLKTQPATGETYPKSDLFNKAYHSVSYFIYVFRNYYGMTPTEYQERSAQELPNCGSAASMAAQGNFYGTDRSTEGIRL
ncbi:AraC family transcriptional regulator, partial [Escherichia coli]|uniref:AraC family transcriptional regulator n=1 Tax=Escherichia coli TaxID=562 RepID=UPI001F4B2A4A